MYNPLYLPERFVRDLIFGGRLVGLDLNQIIKNYEEPKVTENLDIILREPIPSLDQILDLSKAKRYVDSAANTSSTKNNQEA